MSGDLAGTVVCVTGASRGLGEAIARAFAAEGASLVLGARSIDDLERLARELGDAMALQTDVRNIADVFGLVEAAVAEHGHLDVMVNNAGVAIYGPFEEVTEQDLDTMLATNVKGAFFGSQAAYQVMKAQHAGLIVNIGSISGRLHLPGEAAYGATKWALAGLTGVLRKEAEKHGVRVTCVYPGGIDTPFWKAMDYYPFPADRVDPERDFLRPEVVAKAVVDLARLPPEAAVPELVITPMLPQL